MDKFVQNVLLAIADHDHAGCDHAQYTSLRNAILHSVRQDTNTTDEEIEAVMSRKVNVYMTNGHMYGWLQVREGGVSSFISSRERAALLDKLSATDLIRCLIEERGRDNTTIRYGMVGVGQEPSTGTHFTA